MRHTRSRLTGCWGSMVCVMGLVLLGLGLAALPAAAQPFAYVTNNPLATVSVINTATNTVVAAVPVGAEPAEVAITPDGVHAYVTNGNSNTVSVIVTATNAVVATVPVGSSPIGVAITPDGAHAYVTNLGSNTVSVIATATNTMVATVPVEGGPMGVAITPDGAHAYVTNRFANSVSAIATATNTMVGTVPVGSGPIGVAITPDGAHAYVTNSGSNGVSVIATATNTVVATIPVGRGPVRVAIAPDGAQAYVTNGSSNTVSVIAIATNAVVATVPVQSGPVGVAITPDGAHAYVTNGNSNTVSVIAMATNAVVATVPVGRGPIGVAIPAICATNFQPTIIAARWTLTGGVSGPMGCAVSAAHGAPGGRGQVMQFQNGQIVTSPGQGTNMTVAFYQQGADLVVEWGDTSPFFYDKFIVRWDKNGSNVGQRDVPNGFRKRGVWFVPLPTAGTYSIIIEGCDNSASGSICHQGWTVPVTITYVPPPPPTVVTNCFFSVSGPIRDRWIALGGRDGALGCPIENQHSVSGTNAFAATFDSGQIVWDPDRGTNMTVAAYQVETDIAVEWGPTDPYHYDDFNVLWSKDGIVGPQREVDQYLDSNGNPVYAGPNNHGVYSIRGVGPGKYSIQVEGCDKGTFGSTCRQSWTVPAMVVLKVLGVSPAGITYHMPQCHGRPSVGGIIGDRWSKLVGTNGPVLGCPTSAEEPVPNTTGRRQDFDNGEIVWSPDQGADMVVALYQQGSELFVDWGDSFPFSYDKFVVRVNGAQYDSPASGDKRHGNDPVVPSLVVPRPPTVNTAYTVILEGCDTGPGGSTCRQHWTIPVTHTFVPPPPPSPPPPAQPDEFTVDFSNLTPATTPVEAQTQLLQRGVAMAQSTGCGTTLGGTDVFGHPEPFALGDVFKNEESFMEAAIAKLNLLSNTIPPNPYCDSPPRPLPLRSEANSALRFQQIRSKSGSSSDTPVVCTRTGEYDQALTGYLTLVDGFGSRLDNDVRNHIVNDLLNERGPGDPNEFTYCGGIPETENHLEMIESARYLTNQILYAGGGNPLYDNEANGMNHYMLLHLQAYLKDDFIEYNSKPYQTFTDNAIQNLHDFAKDRRVKMATRLVLDYISAKYAVTSNSLRRSAPYRRRPSHYSPWLLDHYADTQNARFTFLSGMFQINDEAIEPDDTQPGNIKDPDDLMPAPKRLSTGYREDINMLSVSTYRAPLAILELLMNPAHRSFFQRIRHDGVEIYSSTPDYLITAGGYWMGSPYTFLGGSKRDDEGAAVTTTLMPTGHFVNADDLIRFDGYGGESIISESNGNDADNARKRTQTCVAPDFACGLGPMIPKLYFYTPPNNQPACFQMRDAACASTKNSSAPWTFVDFASPWCNNRPIGGFFAAVYREPQSQAWGFFEAHPRSRDPNMPFTQFVQGVCTRNGNRTYSDTATNTYVMSSGATIKFKIPVSTANKYDWPLVSTGKPSLDQLGTDVSQWPLASGDILNSVGHSGLVTFDNPGTGQRIILDFSDYGEPKRTEQ